MTVDKGVKVHTCRNNCEFRDIERLSPGRFYYSDDPKFKSFKALPEKCSCKKSVTLEKAETLVARGQALLVYKPKEHKPLHEANDIDISQIVMVVNRSQTPRVDLVTRSDVERAYIDGRQDYIQYIEEIHLMIETERAKLIVPFKPDLLEGRLLFPFGSDQRTKGGHS